MLGDTIVACASAPGSAERAVLRLSGPAAAAAAAAVFAPALPAARATVEGRVRLGGGELPAFALVMPAPRSFTGETVVELHVPGGALVVQLLLDRLLRTCAPLGLRLALPGEFTARAVQHGRLDAAAVEGLLLLLHAADRRECAAGLQWLRGGLGEAVAALRGELQDALAAIEAGLDFDDGGTGALPASAWLPALAAIRPRLGSLLAAAPAVVPGGEVLLLGAANAGKSSLANALAGRSLALVDAAPGTTRDLLRVELEPGVALWDAPGDLERPGAADAAALALRDRLAGQAAALLVVLDATDPRPPALASASPLPWFALVWTKTDLVEVVPPAPPAVAGRLAAGLPVFATSARTGAGLPELRERLRRGARAGAVEAGAPVRQALAAAAAALARAVDAAAAGDGPELVAVELQAALRALDGVQGAHSPEHLLDRIYRRFCLGK